MRRLTKGGLPDAGGLSGVKRMQMQERGGPGPGNTGVIPRKPPVKTMPAGYENLNATRLSVAANPKFPRRRGQG